MNQFSFGGGNMRTSNRLQTCPAALLFGLSIAAAMGAPWPGAGGGAARTAVQSESTLISMIRAQARRLVFDTVLGAADAQPLFMRDRRRYGFVKIEPETGAYRIDSATLAGGRVIARIPSQVTYTPLGLGPGINWWWVDQRGGRWRSVLYSEASNAVRVTILDSLRSHPHHDWRQSIARVVEFDTIVAFWSTVHGHCVPALNLPAEYWQLERASPWISPAPPK